MPPNHSVGAANIDEDVVDAFAAIYRNAQRHRQGSPKDASLGEAVALSDEYTARLHQVCKFFTENRPENPQVVLATNGMFIWKVGEILLLRPVQHRPSRFRQLIEGHFQQARTRLIDKLVFLGPKEFVFHLSELSYTDPRIHELIRSLEALILSHPVGGQVSVNRSHSVEGLRDFHDEFTLLKGQFEGLGERIAALPTETGFLGGPDNLATVRQLKEVLGVLSGNHHDIIDHFRHETLLLLSAYLSFSDPFLKQADLAEFLGLWRGKNKPDHLPNFNDEMIVTAFSHCESPHDFLNAMGPLLPPWFAFHFGDVLLTDDKRLAKQQVSYRERHLSYPEFLTRKYLEYLSECRVSFQTFATYFDRFYRCDDTAPFDILVPYAVRNHTDTDLLVALRSSGSGWIVHVIVQNLLEHQSAESPAPFDDLVRLLFFSSDPETSTRLQHAIYRTFASELRSEKWLQTALDLCDTLRRRDRTTQLQFEEIHILFQAALRCLKAVSAGECLKICAKALKTLPKNSPNFTEAVGHLLAVSLAAHPTSPIESALSDLKWDVLLQLEAARAFPGAPASPLFPRDDWALTARLSG